MPSEPHGPARHPEPPAPRDPPSTARPATRLHPFSLVRGISLRQIAQTVPGALVAASALGGIGSPAAVVPVLLVLVALRVVAYLRHTYELGGESVVERRGILQRRERTVDLGRVQQVEVEQGLLDRLVGTAVVRLETASDAGESELELRVVSVEEASRLRASLPGRAVAVGDEPDGVELVHLPLTHIALAAVTGPRLLAIPVVVGGLVGFLVDLGLAEESSEAVVERLGGAGVGVVAAVAVAVLVVAVVVALILGLLRDGDFRIRRVGDDLHVRRGLLATRDAVVPIARLQQVAVQHSLVRRALGFGSLVLYSAGGAAGQRSLERRLTVPLARRSELAPLALRLLGDAGPWPTVEPHPRRARPRVVARWWRRLALPAAGGLLLLSRAVPVTGAVLVVAFVGFAVVATGLGVLEHRHLASGRTTRLVVARGGSLSIREVVAPTGKVQGTRVRSSPFQRRRDLATLVVHIAGPGGAVVMPDLGRTACAEHQSALERTPVSAGSAAP